MDPDQNKTPDQNTPIPEAPTPAYNNTDYWNQATENTEPKITEPVNPPEPLSSTEPVSPVEPETATYSQPEPQDSTPVANAPDTSSQTTDPSDQKWDDPPASSSLGGPDSPPPSSENKSNTLAVVIVVIVTVLLGAIGLFAFKSYQSKYQVAVSPTPVATPEAVATPDPTADWIIYTNKNLPYTFKYPNNMALKENSKGVLLTLSGPTQKAESEFNDAIVLNFSYPIKLGALATLKQYAENSVTKSKANAQITMALEETDVNGVKGYTYSAAGLGTSRYVLLPFEDKVIEIIDSTIDPGTQGFSEIVNLIFSTFSFALASPSPIAAGTCEKGFKAFKNSDISLCYPETLKLTTTDINAAVLVFDNGNETLKVTKNFQGGWGGSQCLFIDKTTVSGYASKRLSWKTEQAGGAGCDNTYTSFAEMVNEGNFKFPFPYALELTAKKAPFQDNSQFMTIESSFQVTNPIPNGS